MEYYMVIESILSGIISTLSSCIFGYAIETTTIKIDNAPSWYEHHEDKNSLYSYASKEGGIDMIEPSKQQAKREMINKIQNIVELTIKKRYENITNNDEKEILKQLNFDQNLENFITTSGSYYAIEHDKGSHKGIFSNYRAPRVFVGMKLNKKDVIVYEEKRLQFIASELTKNRANKGFEELERGK